MGRYDDILTARRPLSTHHAAMPRPERAKQFMPYAALKGYDEELDEKEALYAPYLQPSEEQLAQLDAQIFRLQALLARGERPRVKLEYFVPIPYQPDGNARLGRYRACLGRAEKLCLTERALRVDGQTFCLDDVTRLDIAPADTQSA